MKCETHIIRSGYDFKKCLVHARCAYGPDMMIATSQYLDVSKSDVFESILLSTSRDEGKTWTEFEYQEGLKPIVEGNKKTVGCDATPMYHKKTGKFILLGQTAVYSADDENPVSQKKRYTFYSVFDKGKNEFCEMKFIDMPEGYEDCGNGCGQSVEMENGDLLIPLYYKKPEIDTYSVMVIKCSFDGENIELTELGNSLTIPIGRGLYEPSLVFYNGMYYMTMRNDECALVAKSKDGLGYEDMQLWTWEDGRILQSYNTQQHWAKVKDKLCLVYTRRDAKNNHVFRHRAPLYMAQVNEDLRLIKESEIVVVPERGARLGNFGTEEYKDGKAIVMASEWMQKKGCEKYGSDNAIFISFAEA